MKISNNVHNVEKPHDNALKIQDSQIKALQSQIENVKKECKV